MCEQVKSLDVTARNAVFKEKAPSDIVEEVLDVIDKKLTLKRSMRKTILAVLYLEHYL